MNLNTLSFFSGISFLVFAITIASLWLWASIKFLNLNREYQKIKVELECKFSNRLTTVEHDIYQNQRRYNIQINERLNSLLKFLEIEEFKEPEKTGLRKRIKNEN